MAKDDPGRQPFVGSFTANSTSSDSGLANLGPISDKKRLVVESVSAQLVTSTSGGLYTMQINMPFQLFLIPVVITDGPFNLRRYYATHAVRFYVDPGESIQFQVATYGDAGQAGCCISGYFLDPPFHSSVYLSSP
jgi:hypothetical protein